MLACTDVDLSMKSLKMEKKNDEREKERKQNEENGDLLKQNVKDMHMLQLYMHIANKEFSSLLKGEIQKRKEKVIMILPYSFPSIAIEDKGNSTIWE